MENHEKSKEQLIKEQGMRTRIITKILLTLDLDKRLKIILDELTAFLDVDIAGIYLVDDENITLRAHRGLSSQLRFNMLSFTLSDPPDWIRKISILHMEPDGKTSIPEFALMEGIQEMINIPLFIPESGEKQGKKWLGSIFVASRKHVALKESDFGFLQNIANPLALAIDHALAYLKSSERLIRLETLHEIDKAIIRQLNLKDILQVVLDRVPKTLGADAVVISLLDGESDQFEVFLMKLPNGTVVDQEAFKMADSLLHWFIEHKRTVIIYDLAEDPRLQMHREKIQDNRLTSYLGVPLIVHEKTIGILHILTIEPKVFEREDVNFFQIMAGQVAIAIDNVRMFESLRSHALKLEKSVAELKKKTEELERSRDSLIEIHKIARIGRWDWNIVENRFDLAEENHDIFGINVREFGGTYEDALNLVHPEDLEYVKKAIDKALQKSGSLDIQHRIVSADGRQRHIHQRARICFDDTGHPVRMTATAQDITREKQKEHLAIQYEKMASLGRVATGIAHEIRNPLSGINIILDAVKENLKRFDDYEDTVNMIHQAKIATAKIERVTKRVMDYTRPGTPRIKLTDINSSIRRAIQGCLTDLKKSKTELITDLNDSSMEAYADNQLIEQLVINLISNAIEAMAGLDEGKKLFIGTYSRKEFIVIKVGDSGHGLYPDEKEKIFEPFYTRKRIGSGIGLSICKRIAADHGGTIEANDSSLGGAEFTIKIPTDQRT